MAVLNIGRSATYGMKNPEKELTDEELLEKEKRIQKNQEKINNSMLYSLMYNIKSIFVVPERIDLAERKRLQKIHSKADNATTQQQTLTTNKTDKSIWTLENKNK